MQILLPLRDNRGKRLPRSLFDKLLEELSETFGGVTAYIRSPAEGQWTKGTRTKSGALFATSWKRISGKTP